jgi:ribosomal protein S18 acetylase RimI-like enzyme
VSIHLREAWRRTSSGRTLYHGTGVMLAPGEVLAPNDRRNYDSTLFDYSGVIFLTDDPALAFFYAVFGAFSAGRFDDVPHVYEVTAPDARPSQHGEWTAPEATVVRDVTSEAKVSFRADWESVWKPMILSAPTPGMPTPKMIQGEFERRMAKVTSGELWYRSGPLTGGPLHIGTERAAAEMAQKKPGMPWHVLRLVGPMHDEVVGDNAANYAAHGEAFEDYDYWWPNVVEAGDADYMNDLRRVFLKGKGIYYYNASEDEDSVSAVVPDASWLQVVERRTGLKTAALDFDFGGDGGGGQYSGWVAAYEGGVKIGYLDWAVMSDEPGRLYIQMVEVEPEHRGKGIASAMLDYVVREQFTNWGNPAPTIVGGMLTDDGAKWWPSVQRRYKTATHKTASTVVPLPPGETPIPSGTIRAFHYTRAENADSIRQNGLRLGNAKGQSYGEPNGLWFDAGWKAWGSVDDPGKALIEVALPPDTVPLNGGFSGSFVLGVDVPPSQVVAIHSAWHGMYRYFIANGMVDEVKAGDYDDLLSDPSYGPAIEAIKGGGA